MKEIVFHSFYYNDDFSLLKNTLLYSDKIIIPINDFVVQPDDSIKSEFKYFPLIPKNAIYELEYLKKNNLVEFHNFRGNKYGNISNFITILKSKSEEFPFFMYPFKDFIPLIKSYSIDINEEIWLSSIPNIFIFIASIFLGELSSGKRIPLTDNRIIFDLAIKGLKDIFELKRENDLGYGDELNKLKEKLLTRKIINIRLPRFEFKSFDDVLELKHHLKDNINTINKYLYEISTNIDCLPWEPEFNIELNKILNDKIYPQLKDYEKEIKYSSKKIIKSLAFDGLKWFSYSHMFYNILPGHFEEIFIGTPIAVLIEIMMKEKKRINEIKNKLPMSIFVEYL